jgi:hypothetical protein
VEDQVPALPGRAVARPSHVRLRLLGSTRLLLIGGEGRSMLD